MATFQVAGGLIGVAYAADWPYWKYHLE